MKIKVCGITQLAQLQALEYLGVDYAGMIFYSGSKRWVGDRLQAQQGAIRQLKLQKVGVFVNADKESILQAIETYGLDAVQLHGDERAEFCLDLMERTTVIKAVAVGVDDHLAAQAALFEKACHYLLFDTKTIGYGGSGTAFDWSRLDSAGIHQPFFLSGGIGPEDAEKLAAFHHPMLHAVDVNSRFETAPGIKDLEKIKAFVQRLRQAA